MQRTRSMFMLGFALLVVCGWDAPAGCAQQRFLTEEFRLYRQVGSEFLPYRRDIIVWMPPGYATETARRYPVLYMHDGATVFAKWRIDEIAKPLIASRQIEPLIIVMVSNGGTQEARFDEYTPTKSSNFRGGGKADSYGRMLVEEIKPFIDAEYRTLTDAANTGLGGVSLGGLVSLYLGLKHPTVFGKLAVISPSVWWDDKLIVREVKKLDSKPATRIWLDIGTGEGTGSVDNVKGLRDALVKKGWVLDSDLKYFEAKGGRHDEESFTKRAEPMLKYLFPPAATPQESQESPPIRDFLRVNKEFCTGGQPRLEHLARLKEEGVRAIINLRQPSEHRAAEEQAEAERLGLRYFNIPVAFAEPKEEQVAEFLKITDDAENRPAFIHCTGAIRVGAFWMIRRVLRDGWTVEDAEREAEKIGLRESQHLNEFARAYIEKHGKK